MSTPAAVPIAINASPSRHGRKGADSIRPAAGITTKVGSHGDGNGYGSRSFAPPSAVATSPLTASPMQMRPPKHVRRASRIEMLTELLLPEAAFSPSRLSDPSSNLQERRQSIGSRLLPVDAERADALRAKFSCITARTLLEDCSTAAQDVSHFSVDADVDLVFQQLAQQPSAGPILLRQSMETTAAGAAYKESTDGLAGLLSLEDVHSFLSLLFCPAQRTGAERAAPTLVSPPPSPGVKRAQPFFASPAPPPVEQLDKIQSLARAKKPIAAGLVANLSGMNRLCTVSPNATLDTVLAHLADAGTSHIVVVPDSSADRSMVAEDGRAPLGLISRSDVLSYLVGEASQDAAVFSVMAERLDELSSVNFTSGATAISSDKTVLDAMALITNDGLQSIAVLDARGVFLSPLSSAELAHEVIRAESRKIFNMPLASLVKTMRSRRPEGTGGKDTHPAVSVSLSSQLSRAISLMQTTSSNGIFVLDDLVPAMTPPLSTISASSPTSELGPWHFGLDARHSGAGSASGSLTEGDLSGSSAAGSGVATTGMKAAHQRRSSTSFWTAPRSRGQSSGPSAVNGSSSTTSASMSLSKIFAAQEATDAPMPRGTPQAKSPSTSVLGSSFVSSTSPPISTAVGGPGFVRCHRPRSMSMVQAILPDAATLRREDPSTRSAWVGGAGIAAVPRTEASAGTSNLSRSSSLSVSGSSLSSLSQRGESCVPGGHSSLLSSSMSLASSTSSLGSLAQTAQAASASGVGASALSLKSALPGTGCAVAYAEGASLAPVRFHLDVGGILAFIAHCAGLQQPPSATPAC